MNAPDARIGGLGLHFGQGQLSFALYRFWGRCKTFSEHRAECQGPVARLDLHPHGDGWHFNGEVDEATGEWAPVSATARTIAT